ncbi:hypothetical protein [Flavobacterium eburneipallidum]|uniref:hypothetical protein n=1 Tax=Flavobacterium eburneipallidum TaxID=3003263 RepID=UPI0022AC5987|nr:hypothetical protein [Flavobacterium eburneipallidum]
MKIKFLLLIILTSFITFSQSVNDYKAVIIPTKYDFQNVENQYRLQTLTKYNLEKAGFSAYYNNEQIPAELNDRCSLLYIDVKKDNSFMVTKLFVTFRDCNNKLVFQSEIGKSREKDFESAYKESLNNAFVFVNDLQYNYNGGVSLNTKSVSPSVAIVPTVAVVPVVVSPPVASVTDPNLLYAQPTENGFQLIDKTPKVVMKLLKTSRADSFIAIKNGVQGTLNAKDNQWFFEYYKDDKLVSEKVSVKF